jgi:serine/threonine protein kinase
VLGPGRILSHYRLEETLGTGEFASVYRARDLQLDRDVALKVVDPGSRQSASSILAEARAAAALNHPNVAIVFAVDDSEGIPLIAMELVDGVTLRARLVEGALPYAEARRITCAVATGMASAHTRGIVHGDLKPENVMLTREGVPKVLDFGLSHREDRAPRTTEAVLRLSGTPRYLAPELFNGGRPTQASDVYALGAMCFEMTTGAPLLPHDDIASLVRALISGNYLERLIDVPADLRPILATAVARDPAKRRIKMRELAAQLA